MSAREHIEVANRCLLPRRDLPEILAVKLAEAQAHALLAIAEAILETHPPGPQDRPDCLNAVPTDTPGAWTCVRDLGQARCSDCPRRA